MSSDIHENYKIVGKTENNEDLGYGIKPRGQKNREQREAIEKQENIKKQSIPYDSTIC